MQATERTRDHTDASTEPAERHGVEAQQQYRVAHSLAALAGLAAGMASLMGFIPGLYRDPAYVVDQSHGYDLGNILAVVVLELGVLWSTRGSLRGRLIAVGALGCIFYNFVTYAFEMVLNPATPLYIAVLSFAAWSFAAGFARIDAGQVDRLVDGRLPRRTTAAFFVVLALLFGANWVGQIAGSIVSGNLPAELVASGWPMNPVYVLDLGFALPLAVLTAARLAQRQSGGARSAVSFLVFAALLGASVLLMGASAAIAGQPIQMAMIALFVTVVVVSVALDVAALRR